MEQITFAPSMLETTRKHIARLFTAYQAVTGYKPTFIAQLVTGDRAFASRFLKSGMNVSTYDMFVARLSGIWPDGKPWPDDVPRQAPMPLDESSAVLFAEREAARAEQSAPKQATDWPEDIPRPETL